MQRRGRLQFEPVEPGRGRSLAEAVVNRGLTSGAEGLCATIGCVSVGAVTVWGRRSVPGSCGFTNELLLKQTTAAEGTATRRST